MLISGSLISNFLINTLFFPRLFENTWMTANENKNREEREEGEEAKSHKINSQRGSKEVV